jgi:hypothetical protein
MFMASERRSIHQSQRYEKEAVRCRLGRRGKEVYHRSREWITKIRRSEWE